ncbi:MAG: hypothetical protein IIZ36_01205, partial [Ruminococcus sp.]|nr:hypothetical protein [Ruminococcus sp.]
YELYQSVLDEVHASDELVKRIKAMDIKQIKFKKIKLISTTAACLAAAIIFTFIFGGLNGKGNSFVLKASAAEIGGDSFVKVATVALVTSEINSKYVGDKQIPIENCIFPFPLFCDGRNIKTIKYSVDNAVFLFPYNSYAAEYREQYPEQAAASDKITEKIKSDNKIDTEIEKDYQYSSYTVSFDDQIRTEFNNYSDMQNFPICIIGSISIDENVSDETKAAYTHINSGGLINDESFINEIINDYRVIYDEMLSKISVTAEITYEDGTTDTTSLRFSCISADMQNGFVIGARID